MVPPILGGSKLKKMVFGLPGFYHIIEQESLPFIVIFICAKKSKNNCEMYFTYLQREIIALNRACLYSIVRFFFIHLSDHPSLISVSPKSLWPLSFFIFEFHEVCDLGSPDLKATIDLFQWSFSC